MIRWFLDLLYGSVSAEWESAYPLEESVARLRAVTLRSVFSALAEPAAVGTVSESGVKLQRVIPMVRNSFKPFFLGQFVKRGERVFLTGRFTMLLITKIFMSLWFGLLAFVSVAALVSMLAAPAGKARPFLARSGPIGHDGLRNRHASAGQVVLQKRRAVAHQCNTAGNQYRGQRRRGRDARRNIFSPRCRRPTHGVDDCGSSPGADGNAEPIRMYFWVASPPRRLHGTVGGTAFIRGVALRHGPAGSISAGNRCGSLPARAPCLEGRLFADRLRMPLEFGRSLPSEGRHGTAAVHQNRICRRVGIRDHLLGAMVERAARSFRGEIAAAALEAVTHRRGDITCQCIAATRCCEGRPQCIGLSACRIRSRICGISNMARLWMRPTPAR